MTAKPLVRAAAHLTVALLLLPAGYYAFFTTFRDWDDEGYFALALRAFTDGRPLYDAVYTQYGPFFYELVGGAQWLTGFAFTSDMSRFLTLGGCALGALLLGLGLTRLTGSLAAGVGGQVVAFATSLELVNTPLHPTALVLVLLGGFVLAVARLRADRYGRPGVAIGALAAALVLIKPNIGGLLVIGIVVAAAIGLARTDRARAVVAAGTASVCSLVAIALIRPQLSTDTTRAYLAVLVASLAAVAAQTLHGSWGARPDVTVLLRRAAAAALATAAVVIAVILVTGTSVGGLVDGVALEPLRLGEAYRVPIAVPFGSASLALAVAVLGILTPVVGKATVGPERIALLAVAVAVGGGGAVSILAAHAGPVAGSKIEAKGALEEIGHAGWLPLLGLALVAATAVLAVVRPRSPLWLPLSAAGARLVLGLSGWLAIAGQSRVEGLLFPLSLAWLALVPPASLRIGDSERFARLLLVITGVLQTVAVYPVGGSQARLIVALLVVVLGVVVADGLRELQRLAGTTRWATTALAAGVVIVLLVGLFRPVAIEGLRDGRRTYREDVALDEPGAGRIRLDPELAAAFTGLTREIRRRCSTLFEYPGLGSLHLWTGIAPVTDLNPGDWMELLDAEQQQRIVRALEGRPRQCVVWNETVFRHWTRLETPPRGPLVDYADSFVPVARFGRYVLRVPRATTGGSGQATPGATPSAVAAVEGDR